MTYRKAKASRSHIQGDLVSMLHFLYDPKCLKEKDDLFPMPSKKVIQKKAKELLDQLFANQSDQDNICQIVSNNTKIVQEKTISEKLENFI